MMDVRRSIHGTALAAMILLTCNIARSLPFTEIEKQQFAASMISGREEMLARIVREKDYKRLVLESMYWSGFTTGIDSNDAINVHCRIAAGQLSGLFNTVQYFLSPESETYKAMRGESYRESVRLGMDDFNRELRAELTLCWAAVNLKSLRFHLPERLSEVLQ